MAGSRRQSGAAKEYETEDEASAYQSKNDGGTDRRHVVACVKAVNEIDACRARRLDRPRMGDRVGKADKSCDCERES